MLTIIHSFSEINWRQKLNSLYRRSSMNYRWPYSVCKNTPLLSCYRHALKRKVRIGDRCTERGWLGARVSSISWFWAAKTLFRDLSATSYMNVLNHTPRNTSMLMASLTYLWVMTTPVFSRPKYKADMYQRNSVSAGWVVLKVSYVWYCIDLKHAVGGWDLQPHF